MTKLVVDPDLPPDSCEADHSQSQRCPNDIDVAALLGRNEELCRELDAAYAENVELNNALEGEKQQRQRFVKLLEAVLEAARS
jgi:hypothetical protein